MKTYLLLALASSVVFSACRHKKEVVDATTISFPSDQKNVTTYMSNSQMVNIPEIKSALDTVKVDSYRFILSFYSIGEGRDQQALRKFLVYLDGYEKEHQKALAVEKTPWGREGEVDYCMKLSELSAPEQLNFIEKLKVQLSDAKWVHFFENRPCQHKN